MNYLPGMENVKEVAVMIQTDLSDRQECSYSAIWENETTIDTYHHDWSLSDHSEQNSSLSSDLEKEFQLLKKHATDADSNFLNSLLLSQMSNPKRLEIIMCDILNIPNAPSIIENFKKNDGISEKRPVSDLTPQCIKTKRRKSDETDNFLNRIQEMFPDADRPFLISECQHIKNDEDCSRFINTVMINSVYPKSGEKKSVHSEPPIIDINDYDFEETGESLNNFGSPSSVQKGKKKAGISLLHDNKSSNNEIIDLVNDSEVLDISDDIVQVLVEDKTNLQETVGYVSDHSFENRDYNHIQKESQLFNSAESPYADRINLEYSIVEKSLAEIIEEKRSNKNLSADPNKSFSPRDVQKPSTSKTKNSELFLHNSELVNKSPVPSLNVLGESIPEWFSNDSNDDSATVSENYKDAKNMELWVEDQTANLIRIFPNTDPSYIKEQVVKMNLSSEAVNAFVIEKLERNDMPSRSDYEKKREVERLQIRYTRNFSIEDFLKVVPEPWKYFTDDNRNCTKYRNHSLCYLKSSFKKYFVRDIINLLDKNKNNLYKTFKELQKFPRKSRGTMRSDFECNSNRPTTIDIQFLQEVAFIENEDKILNYVENDKLARKLKFEEAKSSGSLLECQCCFDCEVMVEDIVYCPKDHSFCRECIVKCVEVNIGNGKFQFDCLSNCDEKFSLACLQNALKPEIFSKVIQGNQLEEIKAAGIEDLVQCPFCNYATIMPPEQKVMSCLNPGCLKESCRLCKELNHVPLRCDEVETSEDVKMRTFIENKMTEALVRTCYRCGKKFVKEDGCNKMTCTCGAKMCYVCRLPVNDYSHFNGQGGTEYHKCPLYSTNDELHVDLVKKVGEEAKVEILQANPQGRLLHDPTMIMPERVLDNAVPGICNGAALNHGLRAMGVILNPEGNGQNHNVHRNRHCRHQNPYHNRTNRRQLTHKSTNRRRTTHAVELNQNSDESSTDEEY